MFYDSMIFYFLKYQRLMNFFYRGEELSSTSWLHPVYKETDIQGITCGDPLGIPANLK